MHIHFKKAAFTLLWPLLEIQSMLLERTFITATRPTHGIKRLAIMKLDAIGDYVLFRNFLETIRNAPQYDGYEITLIGNIRYKSLAESLDKPFVDRFVWIDYPKLFNNGIVLNAYTRMILRSVLSVAYDTFIQPTYSRLFVIDRLITKNIVAAHKVSYLGDDANTTRAAKRFCDSFYDELIPIPADTVFEFSRNKSFFEHLLHTALAISKPSFPKDIHCDYAPKRPTAVLFPGAGHPLRRWPTKNFAQIADHLSQEYGLDIIIAGSAGETILAEEIIAHCKKADPLDLTGKSSLVELGAILRQSDLLISNDTSAVHIAASVNTPTVFFLIGNNEFGRFGPYPPEYTNMHALYPIRLVVTPETYPDLVKKYRTFPLMRIEDISVDRAKAAISHILKKTNA